MPFRIDSKTFADEFNSGTTTEFISANVGDEITATINVTFQELFDADDSADYSIIAEDYSTYPFSGKQSFLLSNLDFSAFQNSYPNFFSNGIEITTDVGGGGTFTVDSIITEFTNLRIVCNEATSITAAADPVGKIWVSETITDCNLNYCAGGSNNNTDLSPSLEIDDNVIPNFATTASPLDATDTVTVNTIPFTYEGAYKTGSLTIRGTGTTTYSQSFELIHTFELTPISLQYSEGEYQPEDINKPSNVDLSDLFNNLQSKYVLEGVFKNQVVGGVSIPFDFRETNLVVKVFDKNYSTGGNTNYSYTNFSIVRTSDSEVSNVPLIQAKFTVSFDIENATDSPFSTGNTKVKVGIENIAQTIDNSEDYEQTFLYDNAINTLDAVATAGTATGDAASITNYTCATNSASSATVSFDVEFTANAITQINDGNGRNYFSIFTETQNHTLDYTNSDRVVLQIFKGAGIQNILVDPIEIVETKFITAPISNISEALGIEYVDFFPVQLVVGKTNFFADWSGRDNLRLNKIIQSLVLKNSSTLEEIEIESNEVLVNSFPLIDSKYPSINYSENKGYKIPSSEVRNLIQVYNESDIVDAHYFDCLFPFFIRWEYYKRLFLNDIPPSIIDNTQDFDGVNYFLNRIDDLANWSLNYRLNFISSESGQTFNQTFDTEIITTGYEEHPDVVSRSLVSKTVDGTSLNISGTKYILSNADTELTATWEMSSAPSSTNDFEIEFYIEAFENGSPTRVQRISSVNNLLGSSWFEDSGAGDGLIVKSIDGVNAVGKAYINSNTLAIYDSYRIYYQLYNPSVPSIFVFTTENDISVETFDPTVVASGGEVVTWTLKNGTNYNTNNLNIPSGTTLIGDELDGTCQQVVVTFSTNNPLNIDEVIFQNDEICSQLDVSIFNNATIFNFITNNITEIIFGAANNNISSIDCQNNSIAGNFDLSPIGANLDGIVNFYNNNITSVTFPVTTNQLTRLDLSNNDITGTLDCSNLQNFTNNFRGFQNPDISEILHPTTSANVDFYDIFGNAVGGDGISGVLDVSGLTGLGGSFKVHRHADMTGISLPNSIRPFTSFWCYQNGITSLDCSTIKLGGSIRFYSCPITTFNFGTSSETITSFIGYSTSLTTMDVSGLTGWGGSIEIYNNSSLTSITTPLSNETFSKFLAYNCDLGYVDFTNMPNMTDVNNCDIQLQDNTMTAAEVNQILVDLDSISVTGSFTGRTINIAGTNAAPDTTSGGYNGTAAKANLIAKNFTVTTN